MPSKSAEIGRRRAIPTGRVPTGKTWINKIVIPVNSVKPLTFKPSFGICGY
jgi:hypothetical protein